MKKVLLVARALIPSVTLCGHTQLTLLAEQGKLEYRWRSPLEVKKADLLWADVLVFVRADDDVSLHMARIARAAGKYTIYVLDDDLLNIPAGLASSEHYSREETKELIRQNMAACRGFLSPSRHLLEKYGGEFELAARIEEPTTVCPEIEKAASGPVRIGFAGSVDRAGDINALLSGALRRILREYGERVRVEFFGARPMLVDDLGLRHVPYQDSYDAYVRTMRTLNWDIGLAPMPESEFHRGKHYNKFIEYASYGIAGIYSDVYPYRWAVRDGKNGLLCSNTEDAWYEAIRRLIEDPALRREISAECLREAKEAYSPEATTAVWDKLLGEIETHPTETREIRRYDKESRIRKIRWIWRKLRAWGWKAPLKIFQKLVKRLNRA